MAFAALLLVSFASFDPEDPSFFSSGSGSPVKNLVGKVGAHMAGFLLGTLGIASLLLSPLLFLLGWYGFTSKTLDLFPLKVFASLLLLVSLGLLSALLGQANLLGRLRIESPGGFLGKELSRYLYPLLGGFGLYLSSLTGILLSLALYSRRTLLSLSRSALETWGRLVAEARSSWKGLATIRRRLPAVDDSRPCREVAFPTSPPEAGMALEAEEAEEASPPPEGFHLPPLSLLELPAAPEGGITEDELLANSQILERKLLDFGVEGRVIEIHPGPVITRYEIEPAPGIKIHRIVSLADDLALALKAMSVRVVAPIPGKAAVGVEIPNKNRAVVYLREVLAFPGYQDAISKLCLALGKDTAGNPYVADLGQMPHLLIAGATGSGKSVFLNALILSLVYKATPEEVRLLLVDPKRVELSAYNGLPHLADPVVVDAKEAARKLQQLVTHMEERYRLFAERGARSLAAYNQMLLNTKGEGLRSLPYLVVIIDELADLMMLALAEVENAVARLTQMARGVGIHLIVATQRPSVDVITGVIKANFPARISFQVSSKVDSRTILDMNGAEQLLGNGDMLFIPPGSGKPVRVHGCYVSEPEVRRVVDFLVRQGPAPEEDLLWLPGPEAPEPWGDEVDALYPQAVSLVLETRQASISMLQRRLRVGYNRAARMIEKMESEGIVSPLEGGKPREVLVGRRARE
ncbi:MAG: DNA translocase FtsK 4TM domain-containing protein [candidate division NC10 bacterium]|nr:DNA translocase FtsK 4TM domain-containing protein [candidate division NC10 bacterium]